MTGQRFVFACVCVIAVIGWASSCMREQSVEFYKARVRSLETDLRGQETVKRIVDQRAQRCEEQLRTADGHLETCSTARRTCENEERQLRSALNACNLHSGNPNAH